MSSGGRLRAGQEIHRDVQDEREATWASERTLKVSLVVRGWTCTLHGRADGVEEADDYTILEEVKSTALAADALQAAAGFPEWEAQLSLYLWMAVQLAWPAPIGQLRVVSLQDGAQRIWTFDAAGSSVLGATIAATLDKWVFAREQWLAWQGQRRDRPVQAAHPEWRPGQAEIVDASAFAVAEGRHLLLTAPTGVGKTAAVLAGVLSAAARRGLGVYWATAKGTQQWVAEKTTRAMIAAGTPLRAVTLRSRENACCNKSDPLRIVPFGGAGPVVDCRAEACRFAAGHVQNVEGAKVIERTQRGFVGAAEIDHAAGEFSVCPYELAVELGSVADLVIGDYNQAFDPAGSLKRMFDERDWVVVVDEAHQLPERARGYGSPVLNIAACQGVIACEVAAWAALKTLGEEILRRIEEAAWQATERVAGETGDLVVDLHKPDWEDLRDRVDELAFDHARLRGLVDPEVFQAWEDLAFDLAAFTAALLRAGEDTLCLWSPAGLRLLCRDPAPVLRPTFQRFVASVSMSATLRPTWFHRECCGLDAERVDELVVPSPFPTENRRVFIVNGVSTAWKNRERQRDKLRAVLQGILSSSEPGFPTGNVAFYFGSYDQRDDLCAELDTGTRRLLTPGRAESGDESARERVVAELHARQDVLLATVLGGVYAEGIDLPNNALSTVVIVGPALPPPSVDRRLLQDWYEQRWDAGFDLAYIQPGMTRVVQAAGRVVRSAADRGTVWLVCERFLRHQFYDCLPEDWEIVRVGARGVGRAWALT